MLDKWVVITKKDCPWCDKVHELMAENFVEATYYSVDHYPVLRSFLKNQGINTVPQVYWNGMRIGGYEDTLKFFGRET